MLCLAIGLGILGFAALRRAHRRSYYGGGCGYGWHGPWSGHHGGRWGGGRRRWMMHAALARIDATPAQERAIIAEVEHARERMHAAKGTLKDARGDLAAAIRSSELDDAALGAVLGRVDAATGEARGAILDALRNVHALLDDRQRQQVADMLDRGNGGWGFRGGPGGPYRT
jgi:Spy/CpxP family protein refolding chaperone